MNRSINFLHKLKNSNRDMKMTSLPNKIYMRRIVTRSMRRRFMNPVTKIQRAWRHFLKFRHMIDPITLDTIEHPVFVLITDDMHEYYFSAMSLALYIKESGDYRNPMTRKEMNTVEIRRLVRLSGVEDILNVEECKEARIERNQRDSLRSFFEEEVANAIDTFLQYIHSNRHFLNTGHLVRHMLALVFPTIIVTVARTVRTDPDFIDELFELLESRQEAIISISDRGSIRSVSIIYGQFLQDIRNQVEQNVLASGETANIDVGGMSVRIDLQNI